VNRVLSAALVLAAACSAPATPAGLAAAERLEHQGRDEEALRAFDAAAAAECDARPARARWCASALDGKAGALRRLGRAAQAAATHERIPAAVPSLPAAGAAALVSAAGIHLELGDERRAYDLYWRALVAYPDEAAAEDALRHVLADARRRDPRQLHGVLADLHARLGGTEVGDNLLWAIVELARDDLGDPAAARDAADRLVALYPKSALRDDAAFLAATLARAEGDPEGAVRRLRALLATREKSLIIGSYHSIHLDDAQLELARVLRDDLRRPADALKELALLERHYPESTLRDDALYETAVTRAAAGDAAGACRALADLAARFPESRHVLDDAPSLAARIRC
jgi:tetratricopeptide (TPR) repeat protein